MNPERAKLFIELMKSNTYLFATGVFVAFAFDHRHNDRISCRYRLLITGYSTVTDFARFLG